MADSNDIAVSDIAATLNARCADVVAAALPNAVKAGNLMVIGSLDGEPGQSLKIVMTGSKRGTWADYATSRSDPRGTGDMLKLAQYAMFGGDLGGAVRWAKGFLGLDTMDPAVFERQRRKAQAAQARHTRDRARDDEKKRARAEGEWMGAGALTPASPAVKYLEGRGIDFSVLGKLPGAIRFHHKVYHRELSQLRGERVLLPAMMTKFNGADGRHAGTHVTYLHFDRTRGWVKLPPVPLEKADAETGELTLVPTNCTKKIHSPLYWGAHIALWKGASKCQLREVAPGTPVFVSEGIEDGLSFAMSRPDARVIAAGTLGNIGALRLPPQAGDLMVLAQNDANPKPIEALEAAIVAQQRQAREQGSPRKIIALRPPQGVKDWNDWLNAPVENN